MTAGAAVVAGVLLVTRDEALSTLGILAIVVGALALLVTAAAAREWAWARDWTGPRGALEPMAGPMAWLAAVFAAVVVSTNFLPDIVSVWSREQVFAVAMVLFALFAVLGFGPRISLAWPVRLRIASPTGLGVLGGLIGLGLAVTYLVFLILMRADAATADDAAWARLMELRTTLEVLAFAAAGAVLGVLVQRQALAGQLKARDEEIATLEAALDVEQAELQRRDAELSALTAQAVSAARLLTVDATSDATLEHLEAGAVHASATSVRQARQALIEGLRSASG